MSDRIAEIKQIIAESDGSNAHIGELLEGTYHTDIPYLLTEFERLQAENVRLREVLRVIGIAADMERGSLQKQGISRLVSKALNPDAKE